MLISYAEHTEVRIDAWLFAVGRPRPSHVDAPHHFNRSASVRFLSNQECAAR